jgi:hypothetical protein
MTRYLARQDTPVDEFRHLDSVVRSHLRRPQSKLPAEARKQAVAQSDAFFGPWGPWGAI